MSMQWVTPRNDPTWVSKSADGYYAISSEPSEGFESFHIMALWARPSKIGASLTLTHAQQLCEQHAASAAGRPTC